MRRLLLTILASWAYRASVVAACGVIGLALMAPAAHYLMGYPSGEIFYELLFPICHQYPTRSFWLLGAPLGVCARCLGGYLGVLAGSFALVMVKSDAYFKMKSAIFAGVFFFCIGVGDAIVKFYFDIDGSNFWRFATGALGGLGIILILGASSRGLGSREASA